MAIRTLFTAKVDELLYSFNWYTMRIVDGGSLAPTFWRFVFGHDNLKPKGIDWRIKLFIIDAVKLAVI